MTAPAPAYQFELDVHADLFKTLEEKWSQLPTDDDGEDLAFRFVRAAYGRGYVEALENGETREAA